MAKAYSKKTPFIQKRKRLLSFIIRFLYVAYVSTVHGTIREVK